MRATLEEILGNCTNFSISTFKQTTQTALRKLDEETDEIRLALIGDSKKDKVEEIADAIWILFDVAAREGITPYDISKQLEKKLEINKNREWFVQSDGTFKHKD